MRILLLLSALLAALTGGVAHGRAVPMAQVSAPLAARAERAVPSQAGVARVALHRVNFVPPRAIDAPVRTIPLYADRLLI